MDNVLVVYVFEKMAPNWQTSSHFFMLSAHSVSAQ
jgi:hypothetical protein